MLQVRGVTYRIDRTAAHCYSVVRLLDDTQVGTFQTLPALRIHPLCVDDHVLRDVVRAALRSARTSSVMHVAPVCPPEAERESSPSQEPSSAPSVPAAARPSSSVPPPESALA
ncbi:MAG TPA: hypothetical protein VEQ58_01590 [Polyangiaceae bacterium]|nr:hypothetical protein [Polyangiaceae bacterium]